MNLFSAVMVTLLSFAYWGPVLLIVLFLLYLVAAKGGDAESARKEKRILGIFSLAAFILWILSWILWAYIFMPKPYTGPEPNPSDLWVANEIDLYFVGFDEEKGQAGQIVSNGEVIEFWIGGHGNQFNMYTIGEDGVTHILVRGSGQFTEEEGTVRVSEDVAGILNGVKTITFVRHDNPNYHGDDPDTGPDDSDSP